jgi:sugar O-acyltransferase (sialic acid O-acetyltransferase NeuD family)
MNIIIIGSGGHAGVVIDAIRSTTCYPIRQWWDETLTEPKNVHGYAALPTLEKKFPNDSFFIAIGDNYVREKISKLEGYEWQNVFHVGASYKDLFTIGTYLGRDAIIGPYCKVGKFCIVNTGAILEHDSELGDFSHLCPGVVTGGRVKIGHHTTVGLGSVIRDGVTIGNNCTIGMGSIVTKNIPDNSVSYGNPCRIIRQNI